MLRRARTISVLGLLAAGALGLLAATQPWAMVTLVDGRELTTSGQGVAASLSIVAFVCIATALVLPIAGRWWRVVLGALAVLAGGALAAEAWGARARVDEAVAELVAEATGLAGSAQQAEIARLAATGWPDAAVAGGALAVLVGAWVLATGHRWPARAARAARYERTGSGLAWDAMDDGEDPTR
ncbi:Trp biosynthesis-associated membrane protein [Agrococcus terreus]|uniref:Tryptophan-associated transmembrane protein (Trp_oprn_chp) n=1 Tax=Agrococcus terreus TaxID=574649 RepID=A0ABQ2KK85_9MICO|nr:Trp biosynthesis-associated membrane protein [Agrococcus terreus]GGN83694.1 hypothetical protein GCM10010968_14720 [Agrococcus terreus]